MLLRQHIAVVISTFLWLNILAQNHIQNHSFEVALDQHALKWIHLPAQFHHWELHPESAPDGEAIQGICYASGEDNEYLLTELLEPLEAGTTYHISFMARQHVESRHDLFNEASADQIHWVFSNSMEMQPNASISATTDTHMVRFALPEDQSTRPQWNRYSATYTATGNEAFLGVGYFQSKPMPKFSLSQPKKKSGMPTGKITAKDRKRWEKELADLEEMKRQMHFRVRYYFDNLCVAPIDQSGVFDCFNELSPRSSKEVVVMAQEPIPLERAPNQSIVIEDIYFELDKAVLFPRSFLSLDKLAAQLKNVDSRIMIEGHTDNQGDEAHNLALSQDRAIAVLEYLEAAGIQSERMEYEGFGSKQPIASNDTELGRKQNRRVAFRILK